MIEIIINDNDKGQRVDKFLGKTMTNCSKSMIYKWIRLKKIKVNRKRCEINQILVKDDCIQFFIPPEFLKTQNLNFLQADEQLDIEFENSDFLIVWKNKGLLMHSDHSQEQDTLINRVLKYLYNTKQYNPHLENSFTPASIHRLDRNTEGFVVIAKNYQSLKNLNQLMKDKAIHKKYLAIVENNLPKQAELIAYHYKDSKGQVSISDQPQPNYKKIITQYKVIDSFKNFHLVEITLVTGKSHQIRAQFAHLNNPLYGDSKYGSKFKQDYQSLCAYSLEFIYDKHYKFKRLNNHVTNIFQKLKNHSN